MWKVNDGRTDDGRTTDDGQRMITIVHLSLRLRCTKNRDAANLMRHFHGGHLLYKAVRHPSLTKLVIIFIWFDKGHVVINSLKIIWIFNMANSRNVYLTGISNSEDFHYLHWRLVADYPGHVTTYFRTQCQRPVKPKDLISDIWHSIKIKYPYTKPHSPTPFNRRFSYYIWCKET